MSFMIPEVEYMEAFLVETNHGTEIVPADVLSMEEMDALNNEDLTLAFKNYIEGNQIFEAENLTGWFGRLNAKGFMDCTDFLGPFETEEEAMKEICELYECDEQGNPTPDF